MPELYRHNKTGGIYEIIFQAIIEKTLEPVIVYRNIATGINWVRPVYEFHDGRFTKIE
jgi:hypothetical protein